MREPYPLRPVTEAEFEAARAQMADRGNRHEGHGPRGEGRPQGGGFWGMFGG